MLFVNRFGRALLVAVLVVGVVCMLGCGGGSKPSALVGHWAHEAGRIDHRPDDIELFKDGTGVLDGDVSITWKVENKRLAILNPLKAVAYNYKVSDSRLTLFDNDGDSATYYIPVKCGKGKNYHNPKLQFCDGDEAVDKCNGKTYKPATQFCFMDSIVNKCNGEEFNLSNQRCQSNVIEYMCGNGWYNPTTQFCSKEENVVNKCNGKEFNPTSQRCQNNAIEGKCGDGWYKLATQFCSNGIPKNYGTMTHGGQTYKTVEIGGKTWMAENMNYKPSDGNSQCYNNDADMCKEYGRLYDWNTAMKVCPSGWHLPTRDEWNELVKIAGENNAGKKLRATIGWNEDGNGTDDYGFSILPGGEGSYQYDKLFFNSVGRFGYLWSASASGTSGAYTVNIDLNKRSVRWDRDDNNNLASVRCVMTQTDPNPASTQKFIKSVTGGRSSESVEQVVMQNMDVLRDAYNKRVREKPGLTGKITIKFTIDEFGRVIFAKAVESTMADSELESTVASKVKSWGFEKIDKPGDETVVIYPFTFPQ